MIFPSTMRFPVAPGLRAALAALLMSLCAPLSAAGGEAAAWAQGLRHISAEDGLTLLRISHDLFPDSPRDDAAFRACIDGFDRAAADPDERAAIDDAMSMVLGASRRMGYMSYVEIADEYERPRLARMLADGRWMRGFRQGMQECLARRDG